MEFTNEENTKRVPKATEGQMHLRLYQPIKRKRFTVPITDVIQLKAASNYTWIYIKGMSPFLSSRTLSYYQRLLPTFTRPHKGHLVNPQHIEQIRELEASKEGEVKGLQMVLVDGTLITFSRRRVRAYRRERKKIRNHR